MSGISFRFVVQLQKRKRVFIDTILENRFAEEFYNRLPNIARGAFMNLQAAGIIAEYNPFHNGHRWQIDALRRKLGNVPVVVCMSGCFVQRGEAALAEPRTRARMAVESGADLVLLLPSWYSLRSADYFASGSVKTLAATGLVKTLVCSTELAADDASGTAETSLKDAAAWSLEKATEQQVRKLLLQGLSYGAAWEKAARENQKEAGWFSGANNILGLAYRKAILQYCPALKLILLPRQASTYKDTELKPPYASATAIRNALQKGIALSELSSVMPDSAISVLQEKNINFVHRFSQQETILGTLLTHLMIRNDSRYLYEHSSASRDLCDRFYNARQELKSGYAAFCQTIASKRDPLPAVRRLALQLLLQGTRDFWTSKPEPSYLRVLAFNDLGRSLLKEMKETATLPIITKLGNAAQYKDSSLYPLLQLDTVAMDLYQLLNGNTGLYGTDFTTSPVYIR